MCLTAHAQNSPLSSGYWVRMDFEEPGVYGVDFNALNEMGFDASNIDPETIQIFGLPGGMLPQSNSSNIPLSISPIPIKVVTQSSNEFRSGDKIYFYVDEIDRITYNETNEILEVKKNLYSDHISYFITTGQGPTRSIESIPDMGAGFESFNWHHELIWHEEELTNLLSSGREWFGERITNTSLNFTHSVSNARGNGKLFLKMIAQAFESTSANVNIEGESGTLTFGSIPNQQYGIKANVQELVMPFDLSENEINITLSYDRNGSNSAVSYLDQYGLELQIENSFIEDFLLLNTESLDQSISEFIIQSDREIEVWNITDPLNAQEQITRRTGSDIRFSAFSDQLQKYWVFDPNNTPSPENFEAIDNQNLLGSNSPELIIITADEFKSQAEVMADFRRRNDHMNVLVATIEQVYNEFGSGRADISAIRNFVRTKYQQSNELQYLLLFGKGSFDYKDRINQNSNFVPTYESRNSIHPLFTYSSDDYFGFLEEHEGQWLENRNGDHTLEIGIGRIPVTDQQQADHFIEKWISYQSSAESLGDWRTKVTFVADDGDRNIHQRDADILARTVDSDQPEFEINKLYLDAFEQESLPSGETSPEAEAELLDAVHEGRLLINFTGHGAESGWMQERILTFENMEQWNNPYKLPFLVTATCEFGRNDDPATFSGAEFLLTKEQSGAIGLVTTARPVFSSTNFSLNEALYDVMLANDNGNFNRLGDIILYTKNNSLEGSLNRNFILLGDPSLKLAYPESSINIEQIDNEAVDGRDTLRAYQEVTFTGSVGTGNSFNGLLNFELIDKAQQKSTFGTESSPFSFTEKDQILARGTAEVVSGTFEFRLIIPQNIDYQFGKARLQLYASNETQNDAFGVYEDFIIGGTDQNASADEQLPEGRLFINDTTGNLLNVYPSNINFIALLEDENGINISDNGLSQNIQLTINDSLSYNLNEYFTMLPNQFEKGLVEFPIDGLPAGINTFSLSYWDNRGNRNISNLSVNIESNSSLINEIKNYPNPLENETNFYISHKLGGEFLDVTIRISDLEGRTVTILNDQIANANPNLTLTWLIERDLGYQLEKGMYIYDILISSRTSGLSESKANKLIISY